MLRCQQEKMEKWREKNKRVMACTGGGSRCLSGREGMFFTSAAPGPAFRVPSGKNPKSRYPYGGRIRFSFSIYIPLRDASGKRGTLPRAKKVSTGHFLTFASLRPPFRVPSGIYQKKQMPLWGRGSPFPSTSLRDASGNGGTLPRPEKQSTGLFFTPAAPGPAFRVLTSDIPKKQTPIWVSAFLVRRKGLEPPTLGTGIRCSIH